MRMRFVTMLALVTVATPASAITIQLDYTYDSGNFFAPGSQARAALEATASYFSTILEDTFSAINVPSPYHSNYPGSNGTVTWSWRRQFQHPSGFTEVTINNGSIPANQYVVYAGARSMDDDIAGKGGPGGFGWASNISGNNSFTSSDIAQINSITAQFQTAVEDRGESSGFARWGGSISFDTSSRAWHFNHATSPPAGTTDFYTVAIHEMAHALGFGEQNPETITAWEALTSGSYFYGPNSQSAYGGPVPLYPGTAQDPDFAHWAQSTMSTVYGTSSPQEAAMDPDILGNARKLFTTLDAAALKDIGWTVGPPPAPPILYGDYNNNGIVDAADYVKWRKLLNQNVTIPNDQTSGNVSAADYTVWRTNFGRTGGSGAGGIVATPEPSGAFLALIAASTLLGVRKR